MSQFPTFRIFGERTILLDWPAKIDLDVRKDVLAYSHFIRNYFAEEILDVVPAYHSIAIFVRASSDLNQFVHRLKKTVSNSIEEYVQRSNIVSIPVCYEEPFALDLTDVSNQKNLNISELIQLHTAPLYKVYFLGFLPGFPYLGGLDNRLHVKRRNEPRPLIERGSVGIGGGQTGIYPMDSPGGWNIIGKTPLPLFDATKERPTEIKSGDYIKFEPISKTEFDLLRIEIESGTFQWRKEAFHD